MVVAGYTENTPHLFSTMSLVSQLESLLFVSTRPLSIKKIATLLKQSEDDVLNAVTVLQQMCSSERGICLTQNDGQVQLTTNPENATLVADFLKEELSGELRGAALETLSVIVYRSPISRAEIEHIRGVNCGQSLRNLLLRGLIDERKSEHTGEKVYVPAMKFLNHLGVQSVLELENYNKLHSVDIALGVDNSENS